MPYITSLALGGPNKTFLQMTDYLHEVNQWFPSQNLTEQQCDLFDATVNGWLDAEGSPVNALDVSLNSDGPKVVWAQMVPTRSCGNSQLFTSNIITPCNGTDGHSCDEKVTMEDLEEAFGLRHGTLLNVTKENDGVVTTVIYNLSHTVSLM